jgi:hypothetical protein
MPVGLLRCAADRRREMRIVPSTIGALKRVVVPDER